MIFSQKSRVLSGIGVLVFLLAGCVVDGQVFFTNDTAYRYTVCNNQSYQPDVYGKLMGDCYRSVINDGSCDYDYSYFGCKSLRKEYHACTNENQLRKEYVKECMDAN